MNIASSVTELIGRTPLVRLNRVTAGVYDNIVAKLESINPANSVKDRIGLAMIEEAERDGLIARGKNTIVEPTSGNTGIALAFVVAVKGYRCVLVMRDTMSPERRVTLRAFGAKLVLTDGAKGMRGAFERADEIASEIPGSFMARAVQQSGQPRGAPQDHRRGDLGRHDGKVDTLIDGVGIGWNDHRCRRDRSSRASRPSRRSPSSPRRATYSRAERRARTRFRASGRDSCRTSSTATWSIRLSR